MISREKLEDCQNGRLLLHKIQDRMKQQKGRKVSETNIKHEEGLYIREQLR